MMHCLRPQMPSCFSTGFAARATHGEGGGFTAIMPGLLVFYSFILGTGTTVRRWGDHTLMVRRTPHPLYAYRCTEAGETRQPNSTLLDIVRLSTLAPTGTLHAGFMSMAQVDEDL